MKCSEVVDNLCLVSPAKRLWGKSPLDCMCAQDIMAVRSQTVLAVAWCNRL